MTHIIGGTAGGRRIATPPGETTRPTSDRVREALFSALEAWFGSWEGVRVLDLYAGSGALGLEACSRGAEDRSAGRTRPNITGPHPEGGKGADLDAGPPAGTGNGGDSSAGS